MSACDRFEREGLLALERGEPLDEHFESCPDCRRERAAYERLQRSLTEDEEQLRPRAGWQARVRGRIEARSAQRRVLRRRAVLGGLAAAAAAILVAVLLPVEPSPASIEVSLASGGRGVRGATTGTVGDRLEVTARSGGSPRAEIRVYRDDRELVLRCSSEPPCVRRGRHLAAGLVLELRGSYQPLLVTGDGELPPPTGGGLDADVGALVEGGAEVALGEEIEVR